MKTESVNTLDSSFSLRTRPVGDASDRHVSLVVCDPLEKAGFAHTFSTRAGGVSGETGNDLNLAYRDDNTTRVDENRRRFLTAFHAALSGVSSTEPIVVTSRQTHSADYEIIRSPESARDWQMRSRQDDGEFGPARDAFLSKVPGVLVGIKTADCVPLFLADAETGVVAAVHAGWRGTLSRIAQCVVQALERDFGCRPENLLAALGPAACGACYEVGEDLAEQFRAASSTWTAFIRPYPGGRPRLDVSGINAAQLIECGLDPKKIFACGLCTIHQNQLFFSHRKEGASGKPVGRQLSVIAARSDG
jgi:YfiH family protein